MLVGATTLLTTTYRAAEKAKVQAVNDLLVLGTVALVNLGVMLPPLGAFAALLRLRRQLPSAPPLTAR